MAKTTRNNGQGSQPGQGSKPVPVNQYGSEILNKLSTSIDLTDPNGLEMSAAFDRYVEKVIKPIYPKGTKIKQTSRVDDASGMRYVDWSFRDTNNKIMQAVQAAIDDFTQDWGQSRGILDNDGQSILDPVTQQPAGKVPMQVGGITPQEFKTTITRILNPRTAASVRAKAANVGGSFTTDKNTGKSSWSVPTDALTDQGKMLYRSLRAEVREGDKRWLEGRVALSSLAEGASPANAEERAIATQNRNFRVAMAKAKAMSPEQERQELVMKLARRGRMAAYKQEYEANNPNDPIVKAKRGRAAKMKFNRAATMVKNSVYRAIATILGALTMAVGILAKIYSGVNEMAEILRKRQTDSAKFNLPTEEMQKFNNIETGLNMKEGTFSNVFGNIMRFADPAQAAFSSGIESAATLLQKDAPDLISYVNGGTTHPDQMMYELLADFLNITASKRGGVLQRSSVSEAMSVNEKIISDSFGNSFADLFVRMYERMGKANIEGRTFTADEIKENLMNITTEAPVFEPPQVTLTAAEKGVAELGKLKALWESIKNSIFTHLLAHMSELVALVRNIARTVIGKYNPQWAAAENSAARAKAEEDTRRLTANIYANQADLEPYMAKSKYKDSVEYTREVTRIVNEGDVEAITTNLGLSWLEFQAMLATNGFALQNMRKLQEIKENSNIKMGALTGQTAHTGGTSDAEMANASLESWYAALYNLRDLMAADTSTMFNERVIGKNSILPYVSPEYTVATMQMNQEMKNLLLGYADKFRIEGYGKSQPIPGVRLSQVFPKVIDAVSQHQSLEQAVPAMREAGITFNDLQGVTNCVRQFITEPEPLKGLDAINPVKINVHIKALGEFNRMNEIINSLAAIGQYLDTPDYSVQGNELAAAMTEYAQSITGTELNEALVRQELLQQLSSGYGLAQEAAMEYLKSSSFGEVSPAAGTNNELRFEITVKGLKDANGKDAVLSGNINAEGGVYGVQMWKNNNIDVVSITEAYMATQ